MSQISGKIQKKQPEIKKISRKTVIAIGIVFVICIAVIAGVVLTKQGPFGAGASVNTSVNTTPSFTSAGALYTKSVDLANAGNYNDALVASDEALAQNISAPHTPDPVKPRRDPVELGRYNDAIVAADVAINTPGNLTTLRSIAWYR